MDTTKSAMPRLAVDELVFEKPEPEHLKGTYELYAINREKAGLRFVEPNNTFTLFQTIAGETPLDAQNVEGSEYKRLSIDGRFEWLGEDERPAWLSGRFDVAEPVEATEYNDHVVYFLMNNKRASVLGLATAALPKSQRRLSVTRISFVPEAAQSLYRNRVAEGHLLIAFVPPRITGAEPPATEESEEAVELLARPCKSAHHNAQDGGALEATDGGSHHLKHEPPGTPNPQPSPERKRSRTG